MSYPFNIYIRIIKEYVSFYTHIHLNWLILLWHIILKIPKNDKDKVIKSQTGM